MKKIFKNTIQISHHDIETCNFDVVLISKSQCKNKSVQEACKEFNNLKISEIYIDTSIDLEPCYYNNDYIRNLYFMCRDEKCDYYEVVVTGW